MDRRKSFHELLLKISYNLYIFINTYIKVFYFIFFFFFVTYNVYYVFFKNI